ncbi:MAG TPA: Asd/ArgC dimerization domain-containing protein [Candidatus Acidoferrales bacterium]|jgi:aspartate-semialdehyde dehydrogenase|nr:Asd/ArgC dimerization domain-containing protein [Candidatus Acidoferrales bacterium]
MPTTDPSLRIVVVGATTLRGKELVQVLGERVPQAKLHLVDDEDFAGTLTEAAGEPAVVQTVDADSFAKAKMVFFAGEPESTLKFADVALGAGASVVDLSGGLSGRADVRMWIPSLDTVLSASAKKPSENGRAFSSPSAPVIISCALVAGLSRWAPEIISIVFLQPASERGQQGIEELEHQTVKLLSFQPFGQNVFGMQAAFNLSDRFGEASKGSLKDVRTSIGRDVRRYLSENGHSGSEAAPAIEIIQAPTFHSHGFSAFAILKNPLDQAEIQKWLSTAGFSFLGENEAATNVSAAGADRPLIGRIERDQNHERGLWLWGVADGLRIGALNAVAIAEHILEQ